MVSVLKSSHVTAYCDVFEQKVVSIEFTYVQNRMSYIGINLIA